MDSKDLTKKHINLLLEMIRTDFKLRYQGSVLGYFWSFMKPLAMFGILYVVFSRFLRIGANVPNYALSLLLGVVLWTFFVEGASRGLGSIVSGGRLIRKISIPIYLLPLATVCSAGINLLLNLLVISIFVFLKDPSTINSWIIILGPLLILQLIAITLAFGYFLAAVYVRFRDIDHVWEIIRQAFFYTIPIIYPLTLIPNQLVQKALLLNPIAEIIQNMRALITYSGTPTIRTLYGNDWYSLIPVAVTVLLLVLALVFFNAKSKSFAEQV